MRIRQNIDYVSLQALQHGLDSKSSKATWSGKLYSHDIVDGDFFAAVENLAT